MSIYGIVHLSVVPLRETSSDASEIISQVLFGESIEVLETQHNWIRVRCLYDDYEGWMDPKQCILGISEEEAVNALKHPVTIDAISELQSSKGLQFLSIGSSVDASGEEQRLSEEYTYQFKGNTQSANKSTDLEALALKWLNTPYLWGGRSIFGIDCSGFTQVFYKILGYRLQRDAYQQANQGLPIDFMEEAKLGDLAFFDNEAGRIIHVGIVLDNHRIIHASGQVRIDKLDQQGIYNEELNKYTHKLRIIKRII